MEALVPVAVALVGIFIAWKVVTGLVKMAVLFGALALAAYLYWGVM